MERSRYALDLLRTELTVDETFEVFKAKAELTPEDFDLIIKNAETVKEAAMAAKRVFHEKQI